MPHRHIDAPGRMRQQHRTDIGENSTHRQYIVDDDSAHGAKTGELKLAGQVEYASLDGIHQPAAKITPSRVLLGLICSYRQVVPILNGCDEFRHLLRGVLKVVIHSYHDRTLGEAEAAEQCVVLSAVAEQPDYLQSCKSGFQLFQGFPGVVGTAIVDYDNLEILSRPIEDRL